MNFLRPKEVNGGQNLKNKHLKKTIVYNLSFPSLNWRPEILPAEFLRFHSYFNQQNFLPLFFLKFNFWIASSMHEHEKQKWNFPEGAFVSNQPNNILVFWSCQTKLIDVCKGMLVTRHVSWAPHVYIKMNMRDKSGIFPRELSNFKPTWLST